MSVGLRIRKARRERLGLTQRELGKALDVDQVNVSRWERGAAEPKLRYIRQLAEITGLPVSWFFEEVDENEKEPVA